MHPQVHCLNPRPSWTSLHGLSANPANQEPLIPWHAKEHGFKQVEGVVEHWQHFHMRKGRCFVAPCCSKTPIQELGPQCHRRAYESLTKAVDHMIAHHKSELQERQTAMLKARTESWKRKGGKTSLEMEADPKDLRAFGGSPLFAR